MKKITILFTLITISTFSYSQNKSSLSLTEIMKGDHFIGHVPTGISWSNNSQELYFLRNPEDELLSSMYRTDFNGSTPKKVSLEERKIMPPTRSGTYNKTRTKKVFSQNGDLYLWDVAANSGKQITNTLAWEGNPVFSKDEKQIFFQMDNNAFALSLIHI